MRRVEECAERDGQANEDNDEDKLEGICYPQALVIVPIGPIKPEEL